MINHLLRINPMSALNLPETSYRTPKPKPKSKKTLARRAKNKAARKARKK